ncbi:MAG: hypothetical protein DWQ42_00405 [Planctomycetota bacterium]|nr:MAG: hypothetical protein DWQ42_00405 [Planctomycetota bacterium]REK40654.1 MAG: hypothetical protein DWQ46_15545 [Planctomycetota bacterium]
MNRLRHDRSIKPLVAQVVPLKINTENDDWPNWKRKYAYEGESTFPIVYVIRADGEMLYGRSGAIVGDALKTFMQKQIDNAGLVLSTKNAEKIESILRVAKTAHENDDDFAAVKAMAPLKRLGKLGALGSHAEPAMEADELANELIEAGKQGLSEVDEALTGDLDDFAATVDLAFIRRAYEPLLAKEIAEVIRKYRNKGSFNTHFEQAELVDRVKLRLRNPEGKERAKQSLVSILTRNAGRPPAAYVAEHYEEWMGEPLDEQLLAKAEGNDAEATRPGERAEAAADSQSEESGDTPPADSSRDEPAAASAEPGLRTWTSRDGKHTLEAEFVEIVGDRVRLRKKNGRFATIGIAQLSDSDRAYLRGL